MIRRLGCGLLLGLVVGGCGRDVVALDVLDGETVGAMAERELEAQNPRMATGDLECPDLDFEVGASVRCVRTTELSEGRIVKVRGSVSVTSRASGGRLHVTMDDHALEFGLAGEQLATELREQYAQRFQVTPSQLDCPYLRGSVGTGVTCRVEAGDVPHDLEVVVTAVDPESYDISYTFRQHRAAAS